MSKEAKLKVLVNQREYAFRDIQILYDLSSDPLKLSQFKSRFKRIESLRKEYNDLTSEINSLKLSIKPDDEIDMKAVEAFDDMYYAVISYFDDMQASAAASAAGSATNTCLSNALSYQNTRLPKLELIKFSGMIEEWQTFYDTFSSLVHSKKDISNIEKFHYLISCLRGSALCVAKGVPITSDNYPIVFANLRKKYECKRILAVTYLDKICNYPLLKNASFRALSDLTDVLTESFEALKAMNIEKLDEFILFYLASRVLDPETRDRFESQTSNKIPTFGELVTFLESRVQVLEVSGHSKPSISGQQNIQASNKLNNRNSKLYKSNNFAANTNSASIQNKQLDCFCCREQHSVYKCPKFLNMNLVGKMQIVSSNKLCANCLRRYHTASKCFSKTCCATCGQRHHTLLHDGPTVAAPGFVEECEDVQVTEEPEVVVNTTTTMSHVGHSRTHVLLGTCMVRVSGCGPSAQSQVARALIDSGAQNCFLSSSFAQRLGLPLRRCNLSVAGLGQNIVHEVRGVTSCKIQPRSSEGPIFTVDPIVMNKITGKMPTVELPSGVRDNFKNLVLADQHFDKPTDIDLLLGAELFHSIYDGKRLDSGPGLPVALHSIFGWVLTGKVDHRCRPPATISSLLASTMALDDVVKRFWEVEEPPSLKIENLDDVNCEKLYSEQISRNPDGRYVVPILLKAPHQSLGESHDHALSRLVNLEKRLSKNESLKTDYCNFMKEYETLGHMRPVDETETKGRYVIPHHCVIRPDSSTTKVRVVFDASARTKNSLSLNSVVYTGPKLQNDVVDILTKFRLHNIVFTADICKMYRNIELRPQDRVWQHILWRKSPDEPVCEFELNTVTYGVTSSPYLAIRTLHQLADDHGSQWPQAAEVLRHDTFMDDIIAGAPSVEAASKLKNDLIELLACAQFELRKWSSNSPKILADLEKEHCETPKSFCEEADKNTLKILGVQWEPTKDFFTYSLSEINPTLTKRAILSNVARIYDPVGWLSPVVLVAKLLLQDLWRLKINWDETVPPDVARQWQRFVSDLQHLKEIQLPRRIETSNAKFELIGFCDGSSKAYGCIVFVRVIKDDHISVNLLIAKSKVAPLKPLTVNRLELCSAILLARVLKHMSNLLREKLELSKVIAFSDSSTVLSWLRTDPSRLKTFVSHRVVKILKDIPDAQWLHVSTHDNPADHSSRGLSCAQLAICSSWWTGPTWLCEDESSWPIRREWDIPESISEMKVNTNSLIETNDIESDEHNNIILKMLSEVSSLSKLIRRVAWCLRFVNNLKRAPEKRVFGALTVNELDNAMFTLVRFIQNKDFADEMQLIKFNKNCCKTFQKLQPFIDELGLLRVGGRLKHSRLPLSAKHPLLLPKLSPLSTLIIDYFHISYLHCGPRALQSIIQRKYWIIGIRNLIRSRLSKCVTCFKVKPVPCQPLMGDLPAARVTPTQCFRNVGIDFCGPFTIKESTRRNAHTYKIYVCVFVCLAVKAVHLEPVTELSTSAFIAALDRFVSRRNLCKFIITDNGTNFIGARRYLNELHKLMTKEKSNIQSKLAERGITWQLNPPTGSHHGGIFESGVKSMKYHFKRVVGSQILTLEEMFTVLTKIEAVLNSRPLCNISTDPSEVEVLTPGHFLTGGPLLSLPEPELADEYVPPRSRWQMLKKLTQSFWRVWQQDYLHTLQQRSKWCKGQPNVQIGDICLIMEPNLQSLDWKMGRVSETHPGKDKIVRVVTLRTATGFLKRPVTKICPFPTQN